MKVFKIHTECAVTRGYNRSLIVDFSRNLFHMIPNTLYDILIDFEGYSFDYVLSKFPEQEKVISEYFDFLLKNEIIFFIDEALSENFTPLAFEYDHPSEITNCILDFSETNFEQIDSILQALEKLGCKKLQIRSDEYITVDHLKKIEQSHSKYQLNSIEFIFKKDETNFTELLCFIQETTIPIKSIILHSGQLNKLHSNTEVRPSILEIKEVFTGEKCCGQVTKKGFINNVTFYSESQNHNTCLNRKVGIDSKGNIKNCPSMKIDFGNIKNTSINNATQNKEFKEIWNVKKDQILICKDCEFRHVCLDCRAFREDPEDLYSKPLKCGYDPYTTKWEIWSENPLKQKAIHFYDLKQF